MKYGKFFDKCYASDILQTPRVIDKKNIFVLLINTMTLYWSKETVLGKLETAKKPLTVDLT
jgi:hypothetical protein